MSLLYKATRSVLTNRGLLPTLYSPSIDLLTPPYLLLLLDGRGAVAGTAFPPGVLQGDRLPPLPPAEPTLPPASLPAPILWFLGIGAVAGAANEPYDDALRIGLDGVLRTPPVKDRDSVDDDPSGADPAELDDSIDARG